MQRRDVIKLAGAAVLPAKFAIAQSRKAEILRFVPQSGLTVLDPVVTPSQVTAHHGWAIYDTLFGVDTRHELKPQMAEGFSVSEDGRTCSIRLRDGLKFHNGEPVRAQDCAPSLARWAARTSSGQTLGKYVEAWGVADDRTIRITLRERLPSLLSVMANDAGSMPFIMPEHIAITSPLKPVTETIGSGPYIFVKDEYVPGSSATYRRNADYVPREEPPDWSSGGKIARFDRVEYNPIPEAAAAVAALQTGEVDWFEQVPADLVPLLRRDPNITIGNAVPRGYSAMMRFNHLWPPFNNVACRRAVLMAVNQTDYMTTITGDDTSAYRTCRALLACGSAHEREFGAPYMPGNIDSARAALKAAGYHGEKVVIISPADTSAVGPMGDITHDLLTRLGMNVELSVMDTGTMAQRRLSKEPIEKGGWSLFHGFLPSHHLDSPVSNGFARGLGSTGYFGWFADDVIEQRVREWMVADTAAERDTAADAFQTRGFETVPSVPLGQFHVRTAYRRNLVGRVEGYGVFFWNVHRV